MLFNSCECRGAALAPADLSSGGAMPPASAGSVTPEVLIDIAVASRICAAEGVFDAYGHLSMRHPADPNRFLMTKSMAPALATPDDVLELDLECQACDSRGRPLFLERFIHGEIYKARPDVCAIVHSHSPSVVPFSVVPNQMRAIFHTAAFIAEGVPVFDIETDYGPTDMLVGTHDKGRALAQALGDKCVCLMRAHGSVAVGPTLKHAVFRAVYTEINAKLQLQATMLGGPIKALSQEEGRLADAVNLAGVGRPWDLWKRRALAEMNAKNSPFFSADLNNR